MEAVLHFFHGVGAVVWFAEPTLRELVVLEPQWVRDAPWPLPDTPPTAAVYRPAYAFRGAWPLLMPHSH